MYEVANGLRNVYLKKKITAIETSTKINQLMAFSPKFLGIESLIKKCISNSLKYDISIYDSAYLTLALENKIALITADMKLVSKLKVFKEDVIIPLDKYENAR